MKNASKKKTAGKEEHVTMSVFEKAMESIAKSFDRIDTRLASHDRAFESILNELKSIHDDNKHFRESFLNLNREEVIRDRNVEDLRIRVERLEKKILN